MLARISQDLVGAHPGFEVVAVVGSGSSALRAVEQYRPDLVLLDVYLPDFDGIEVLHRLRALRHDVEVIMVTAARDRETVRRARLLGVRHYLVKPFTRIVLHDRLDDVSRVAHAEPLGDLDQRDVDSLLGRASSQPTGTVASPSLRRVSRLLSAAADDMSAAEVAKQLGMSRVSARKYLEQLVALGRAVASPRYGAVGRPENGYRALRPRG